MGKYVALLRGINVGGNNKVSMADLKACFESAGYQNVRTYINSGNVLFESPESSSQALTDKVNKLLEEQIDCKPKALVLSQDELEAVINGAPKGFGAEPDKYRYDVFFLFPPLTAEEAVKEISLKEGVDEIFTGKGALYVQRLIARLTQSRITRIVGTPIYQNITIRNWNTTTKLLALLKS